MGPQWNGLVLILFQCRRAGLIGDTPDRRTLRRALAFGLKSWVGLVFFFLVLRVDQILVRGFLGFHELGLYALAVTLAELLWLFTDPFAVTMLPHLVEMEER